MSDTLAEERNSPTSEQIRREPATSSVVEIRDDADFLLKYAIHATYRYSPLERNSTSYKSHGGHVGLRSVLNGTACVCTQDKWFSQQQRLSLSFTVSYLFSYSFSSCWLKETTASSFPFCWQKASMDLSRKWHQGSAGEEMKKNPAGRQGLDIPSHLNKWRCHSGRELAARIAMIVIFFSREGEQHTDLPFWRVRF